MITSLSTYKSSWWSFEIREVNKKQTTNKNRTFIANNFETKILYSLNFKCNGVT